jgi:hypothetical protein
MDYTVYTAPVHQPHYLFGQGYIVNQPNQPIAFDHHGHITVGIVAPRSSNLEPVLPSFPGNDAEPIAISQSASPSSMAPPSRPRKTKAPTLRDDDWEPYKERIRHLHVTQGLSVSEVRDKIEEEFGFQPE